MTNIHENSPGAADLDAEVGAKTGLHQDLFDRTAKHYDLFNSILSLGADRRWRRTAADLLKVPDNASILDVGTGTAVSAITIARRYESAKITAIDVNSKMLAVAGVSTVRAGLADRIELKQVNGEKMPFPDAAFDGVLLSFTLEDMMSQDAGISEIARVLRPGAPAVVLGLGGLPSGRIAHAVADGSLRALGLILSAVSRSGYQHVRDDIRTYDGLTSIRLLLEGAGFEGYQSRPLSGGIVMLHHAFKGAR
jgi:demethylmenaquinone methyltransferase / 2-methoxy-6-polyprenyl-1,4-benzoquinol methylase